MITDASICNLGLAILSAAPIIDLDEASENANRCKLIYPILRDNLLSEHNWNFARKQHKFALLDETPKMEWAFVYQVPSDCIRVLRCQNDTKFMIYGQKLYSNTESLYGEYFAKITDPSKFSIGFSHALSYRIAALLCYGITQNATLAQLLAGQAIAAVNEAKWTDGQEGIGTFPLDGSFITARQ